MAALLAVAVAADPRISHMALCLADCPPAAATAPSVDERAPGCCSTAPASRPQPPVDDHDDCGCDCCHIVAGYRTERDARSTFVSPAPLKLDFPPAIATFSAFTIAPPQAVAASTPVVIAAGAGSLPCLLCNHLRT